MDIETYALLMRHIKEAETGVQSAEIDEEGHLIIKTYSGDELDVGKVVEDIDDELSETSENAVQNKVVTNAIKSNQQGINDLKYTVTTNSQIDELFNQED